MDRHVRRDMERLASMPMPDLNPVDFFSWHNLVSRFMARRVARKALIWQEHADRLEQQLKDLDKG